jgi:ribonuclease D
MKTITKTEDLVEFCKAAASCEYITIDTEFLRERSYYSKLCLVQLAMPGRTNDNAVLVDPLSDGISLEPLYEVFRNESVVKVFHAARQDLEIFCLASGVLPKPLFDTQVAAMVCGFGDQVGYETLVSRISKKGLDKSSRFTDWSRRPLTEAQKSYALGDVTHLRQVYEHLAEKLQTTGRARWLEEELETLTSEETYISPPKEAWKRIKTRSTSPNFLAIIQELAEFRERYAQDLDIPRNRIFKDDAMIELASTKPVNMQELQRSRLLQRDARKGNIADGIIAGVKRALARPVEDLPKPVFSLDRNNVNPALADLLRVLLKAKVEKTGVAAKLIAGSADLDALASGDINVPAMQGWRYEVFGEDAQKLCRGEIALVAKGRKVDIFPTT